MTIITILILTGLFYGTHLMLLESAGRSDQNKPRKKIDYTTFKIQKWQK